MTTLGTEVSGPVVTEIVASAGEARAAEWLGVTARRLAALLGGRGRLNESQLERIAAATGKSWHLWAMEAAARLATTAADRRLVAETRSMFEPAGASDAFATVRTEHRPRVLLVGHYGADGSFLRTSIKKAVPGVEVVLADDSDELTRMLDGSVDMILFNRELGYGFNPAMGVEAIHSLRPLHPNVKMILVSNDPATQRAAKAAGALPGFGKRDLGTARTNALLRDALSERSAAAAGRAGTERLATVQSG